MPHDRQQGDYLISADPARLQLDAIHAYLVRSYWAEGIPRDLVAEAVKNSLSFGVYTRGGEQIGFARVISDYATFAYLADVYILETHRGRGLSKAMMELILSHPRLQGLRRFTLATRDAHGLYTRFGFKPCEQPQNRLELSRPSPYRDRG
jgi:GNAT superfamily N-acetyltransferase